LSETLQPALPDQLDEHAERLMRRLCDKDLTIATAESCTGGMLAALLTDIEGAGARLRARLRHLYQGIEVGSARDSA
jgi:hypothetical protein